MKLIFKFYKTSLNLLKDRMSCSLWMVTVQQKAMVHSKDFTTLLEMFIKKQQVFWNTLKEKQLFHTTKWLSASKYIFYIFLINEIISVYLQELTECFTK